MPYPFGAHLGYKGEAAVTTDAEGTVLGFLRGLVKMMAAGTTVTQAADSPAPALTERTFVVAQTASESGEVDCEGEAIVKIYCPAAIEATTAQLSLKEGRVTNTRGTFVDQYGVKKAVTFAVNDTVGVDPAEFPAMRLTSIVLETSAGVAVAQATAARTFIVVTRRV